MLVLIATGAYLANRVNRLPVLLGSSAVISCSFTVTAFFGNPRNVAEIYRAPILTWCFFRILYGHGSANLATS